MNLYVLLEVPSDNDNLFNLCAEIETKTIGIYTTLHLAFENAQRYHLAMKSNGQDIEFALEENIEHDDCFFIESRIRGKGMESWETIYAIRRLPLNRPVIK